MSGMLQAMVYFGYMAIISLAVSLVLGSVSVQACVAFVKYFYSIATRHELELLLEKKRQEEIEST